MEFPYVKSEGAHGPDSYRPYIPVAFRNGENVFRTGALVDTGSDLTILPLEIAHVLKVQLDDSKSIILAGAGGGSFKALPSHRPVRYVLERKGHRSIQWEGTIYFAENEKMSLLGHQQCLERFDVTFQGPEKRVSLLPRFKI